MSRFDGSEDGATIRPGAGMDELPETVDHRTPHPLLPLVSGAIASLGNGGLGRLLDELRQNGLGTLVASWLSRNTNLPISADQLHHGLGQDTVRSLSERLGLPPEQVRELLARFLPGIVDEQSPNGTLEDDSSTNTTAAPTADNAGTEG